MYIGLWVIWLASSADYYYRKVFCRRFSFLFVIMFTLSIFGGVSGVEHEFITLLSRNYLSCEFAERTERVGSREERRGRRNNEMPGCRRIKPIYVRVFDLRKYRNIWMSFSSCDNNRMAFCRFVRARVEYRKYCASGKFNCEQLSRHAATQII